jgi:hypothetical protein
MPSANTVQTLAAGSKFSSITVHQPPPQVTVVFEDDQGQQRSATVTGLTGPQVAELTWGDVWGAFQKAVDGIVGGGSSDPAPGSSITVITSGNNNTVNCTITSK